MNIHEYQGKELLRKYGVPTPVGNVAFSVDEALDVAKKIYEQTGCDKIAVKAQIHAGGRGKGGGVKIADSLGEVKTFSESILGMNLVTHQTSPEGKHVGKLLIEQGVYYDGPSEVREFYMSILLDRKKGTNTIIYSSEGGMDIEEVADKYPEKIFKEEIESGGVLSFQARRIAFNLKLSGDAYKAMIKFVTKLYDAYTRSDASMIEINPVLKTSDEKIYAADAKIILDDNALVRHSNLEKYRDLSEEDKAESEAAVHGLNFVKLDGNVGCMVNGAGLAMATMDMIKLSGGEPANFLDVGGGANAKTVEAGFRLILKDKNVKAILVNIFGGIVRCDRVATGVTEAYKSIGKIDVPVIVRLQGTNAEEGAEIIKNSGLKVYSAITLNDAATLVKETIK
jgi:succinyl-CoA synthetase beta subunit